MTIFLLGAAVLNTVYLFTRIKLYRLHHRPDPVSSPNAKFVAAQLDFQPLEPPPLRTRLAKSLWFGFSTSWRFLLGMQPPVYNAAPPNKTARVQQLEVWSPGELELMLFNVYSPAHVFLWMATGSSNWMLMMFIMGLVGAQVFGLLSSTSSFLFHTGERDDAFLQSPAKGQGDHRSGGSQRIQHWGTRCSVFDAFFI
jgi:hypothetical protein